MATLNVNKQYADGTILTENQLDAAFSSIETFLNITGINSDNIQDNSITASELQSSSVTESKIATDSVTTTKMADSSITMAKLAAALQDFLVPTGSLVPFAGSTAPSGYLLCDGTAVSRTTYANLYALVGNRFGQGNGSTTFNLPDSRGRFMRFTSASTGRDPDSGNRTAMNTGGATGDAVGSIQSDAFGSHTHNMAYGVRLGGQYQPGPYSAAWEYNSGGIQNYAAAAGANETRPVNFNATLLIKV